MESLIGNMDEIQNLDRMTTKQLCMNQMLATKADVDRIYPPCQEGGRSPMNLEKEYKATDTLRIWNHNITSLFNW